MEYRYVGDGAASARTDLQDGASKAAEAARNATRKELEAPALFVGKSDESWTCPRCGTEVRPEPRGFRIQPVICPCIEAAGDAAEAAYLAENRERFGLRAWEGTAEGIPARYRGCSFDSFIMRKGAQAGRSACERWAADFDPKTTKAGLYLAGGVGSGKTHLAVATLRAVVVRHLTSVRFETSAGLVFKVRGVDGDRFDWGAVERAVSARLLLLDDLGQEQASDFSRDVLFRVVNGRYEAEKPTIITANMGDEQLASQYGAALPSRLYEMTKLVRLTATDYRVEKARRAMGAA